MGNLFLDLFVEHQSALGLQKCLEATRASQGPVEAGAVRWWCCWWSQWKSPAWCCKTDQEHNLGNVLRALLYLLWWATITCFYATSTTCKTWYKWWKHKIIEFFVWLRAPSVWMLVCRGQLGGRDCYYWWWRGCSCSEVQLCYDCVIKIWPLFSRYVKLPLAEEYSTPCSDKGTCNGSSGVAEGKAFQNWLEAFQLKASVSI